MSGDAVRRAAAQGQGEWLKRLFASGANPCECDDVGCTPLHYATMNGFVEAIIICCINDRGTDPAGNRSWALQQQTTAGWTALHIAVMEGLNAPECVRALLAMGCDPWLEDLEGRSAFDCAEEVFAKTGTASSELIVDILRNQLPTDEQIMERRREAKEAHWRQEVRRDNRADIADFVAGKRDPRAPVVPWVLVPLDA